MEKVLSLIPKDLHMMAIGLTIFSTDSDAKLGMRAKLNSKANTIKERKMGAEDTNGQTAAIMKETSLTACSKATASTTSLSPRELMRVNLLRIYSKVRAS